MKRRVVVVSTCALAIAALAVGLAQTPQQRPVFRSGAIFVSVDAYPRKDGKVIEGLTKADFEVFEDGKPQTVEELEFIRVAPNTPDEERRDPSSVEDSDRQAADPHNRVFVVYLDIFSVTLFGSHYARQPIIEFLSRTIGPKDLFGVMTPELPASAITFARRTETLEAELVKYWDWGEGDRQSIFPRNNAERQLMLCNPDGEALVAAFRKDETFRSLEQMVARLGALRDERKNILFVSEGWGMTQAAPMGTSRSGTPSTPSIGVGPTGRLGVGTNRSGMAGGRDRAWCDSQAAGFSGIDYQNRFRELVTQATRANVSFYPIDVGGLRTYSVPASRAPQPGENPMLVAEQYRNSQVGRMDMLQDLASATDGKAIVNTNDLTGAVRKISDDLSAYYLLGYYSNNTAADGKFRRIEVKVKTSGAKVSARRGYLGPTAAMKKAEEEAASKPPREDTAVDRELARLSRLRTDAKVYTAAVPSKAGLDVVVEIASAEFGSGRWTNGGTVNVSVSAKEDGAKAVSVDARLDPGARGILVKVPLAAASAAGWRARIRVEGGGEVLEDDLDVPPAPTATLVGEPAVFRAGAGPRSPLRPVADYKFFRTERMHVEWTLAKALDDCTARLLNKRGDVLAIPVTLTERPDGDRLVLAADLSLAPLADGDYVIEVSATAGSEKVQKLLAFRVVR